MASPPPGGWEDFDFWCRFVELGLEAQKVPKLLGVYCHHEDSMKNTETDLHKAELRQLLQRRHPWLELTTPNPFDNLACSVRIKVFVQCVSSSMPN